MKAKHGALLVLLLLGIAKLPLEQRVHDQLNREEVLPPRIEVGVMENLGQMGLAASLGGLRSMVASGLYLHSASAWEDKDWGAVDSRMSIACRLDPRYAGYWDNGANFMSYDAASWANEQPKFYGKQLYTHYVQRGIEILEQGLRYLPKSSRLQQNLGEIFSARVQPPDHKHSGEAFLAAYKNGALPVYERRAAYEFAQLADDPSAWQVGYDILKKQYSLGNKLPGVIMNLKMLEQKMNIPISQRIPDSMPKR